MLRRESIVAADLNELRGTLGVRAAVQEPTYTVMDLLQHQGGCSGQGRPSVNLPDSCAAKSPARSSWRRARTRAKCVTDR